MTLRVGVDSGGTFTDVCVFDEVTGKFTTGKISSTPNDPSQGILEGVRNIVEAAGGRLEDVRYFGHGTTIGTNALIQRRGAKTALITTEGFRDVLLIGRQKRPSLFDLQTEKPPSLVSRDLSYGLKERLRYDGAVIQDLDERDLEEIIARIRESGVEAVAVSLLYSFINPRHELLVKERLAAALPDIFLSVSSEVAPEFREYERASTAVVNAFLGPVIKRYIERLRSGLVELRIPALPKLTQSNGGVISFDVASDLAARTVLSGPSTGVVCAQKIAEASQIGRVISFDMGGTSTDVALLNDGTCSLASEANAHGYPLKVPMLDIHTVGAGGGSIAFIDDGGFLKVGPESAAAFPGPACYGNQRDTATVTDANIVLGNLSSARFLDGKLKIYPERSMEVVRSLAEKLRLDVMDVAQGIVSIATANMVRAIRVISVQKGDDPREYALMAFGGGGPLHAARLARELHMKKIVVPLHPGVLCAMGLLLTDLRTDFAKSKVMLLEEGIDDELNSIYGSMLDQAKAWFEKEEIKDDERGLECLVEMRYVGQNYELPVALGELPLTPERVLDLKRSFMQAHQVTFGFSVDEPVQLVTYRVVASGKTAGVPLPRHQLGDQSALKAMVDKRDVWFPEEGGWVTTPVYSRQLLKAGNSFSGPAVVEQSDATTLVLPKMHVEVDACLNLIMEDQ